MKKRNRRSTQSSLTKENIVYNRNRYKGETKFYEEYFGNDVDKLIKALHKYRQQNHAHKNDEHYLVEILK